MDILLMNACVKGQHEHTALLHFSCKSCVCIYFAYVCMCLNKDDYTKKENALSYFVKCIS